MNAIMPWYSELCKRAKSNGFIVGLSYPDTTGKQQLYVKSKYVEFVRLTIESKEIDLAAKIIIDTFEKEKMWH